MLIATLKNLKASQTDLNQYFSQNSLSVDPLEYFDITGKQGWFLGSNAEFNLKQKIESAGKPLKDWDVKINYGIKTGLNEAFIINEEKKNELIATDPKSAEIIKPILRGRDIKRYGYEFAGLYLINSHNGYKTENSPNGDGVFKALDINNYPAIKEHLDSFEPGLSKRQDKGKTQYNLRNCAYVEEFEKVKVAWNRIASKKEFGLVEKSALISDSMHFFTGSHLKYITGVLNSKLLQFLLDLVIGEAAGGNAGNADNVGNLSIPLLDTTEKQAIAGQIEDLVEQILEIKTPRQTSSATPQEGNLSGDVAQGNFDTASLENKIDELVFELYGLGEGERALVLG
ncbi:MAG: TaqI-like C-terminal specificity domain-containing protein [bacterium]